MNILLLIATLILSSYAHSTATKDSRELVPWSDHESEIRLLRSNAKADFFPLSNHFESQENGFACGLASSSIVLNTMKLGKDSLPVDESSIGLKERDFIPAKANPFFKKFTQKNVLNSGTKQRLEVFGKPIPIKGEMKPDYGLQLRQLADVLVKNGTKVEIRVVDDHIDSQKIKEEIIKNLKSSGDYILVNYDRKSAGQNGGGHISPIGAYDQDSDSFLILDVNPLRAPWTWMKAETLIKAMRTFDTVENRGYLLISE